MNITETTLLMLESMIYLSERSLNIISSVKSDIFWGVELSDKLFSILISGSNIISWLILKFFRSFLSLVSIIVLINFYKSLQTHYRFSGRKEYNKNEETKPAVNLALPKLFRFSPASLTRLAIKNWLISYRNARDECEGALNEFDSLNILRKLPWIQARPDVETLNWLNVSVASFWPSIKRFLDIFVFKNLLKSIKQKDTATINRNLSKEEAKLSILISTRRKLESMRAKQRNVRQNSKSLLGYLAYYTILSIIYLKRFIVDFIVHRCKKEDKREIYKVNLNRFVSIEKLLKMKSRPREKRPKTWPNLVSSKDTSSIKSPITFNINKRCKSAPPVRTKRAFLRESLKGLISLNDLRKKRIKVSTRWGNPSRNEVVVEEIDLGFSAPRIDGIKLVNSNSTTGDYSYGNLLGTAESNITEKDENLSFALELSYQTDEQFRITLNSVPLLGHISLTKLNIQSRFMLTLNHPTSVLNKDLKIFETPDDILWPLVNYFQVALVDVPVIDWRFERVCGPVGGKGKCRWSMRSEDSTSTVSYAQWFTALASRYLNPVRVLNHTYSKYLVHLCLCLSLRWLKPFDLKVGDKLYIKSIC